MTTLFGAITAAFQPSSPRWAQMSPWRPRHRAIDTAASRRQGWVQKKDGHGFWQCVGSIPAAVSIPHRFASLLLAVLLTAWSSVTATPPNSATPTETFTLPRQGYSFLAGGHWYGAHENVHSLLPASSMYAAIPAIQAAQPDRIFALGDVVRDASDARQVEGFMDLQRQLGVPVHLAPGNHDLLKDGSLPAAFGPDHQHFYDHGDRFLVLNTEGLARKQLGPLLKYVQDSLAALPQGRNMFVFTHRLVWALGEPGLSEMDDFANEPIGDLAQLDSIKLLYDAICRLGAPGKLWWFSGDVGASWSLTLFQGESRDSLRHFYAAGLGDRAEDALWQVRVDSLGEVKVEAFPLVDAKALDPHQDVHYWRGRMKEVMAENKAPGGLGFGQLLTTRSLWIGLILGAVIGVLGMFLIRRRRK